MVTKFVKDFKEMAMANRLFEKKKKSVNTQILIDFANLNESISEEVAEQVKFKGTLISMIDTKPLSALKIQVLSSAQHSAAIETGVPIKSGYVSFDEQPLLESWVKNKLMGKDPQKAKYFLRMGAVKIGEPGSFPFGYPKGLQFMKIGFLGVVSESDKIISRKLRRLA